MGANSKIEWCDHTFNPWIGCAKVSDGCRNCYAESMMDHRMGKAQWGENGTRARTSEANWKQPIKWDRAAAREGIRKRVFCASLADVFEVRSELAPWRADLFELIRATPNLDWLLLTKRPLFASTHADTFPENVWIGASIEDQKTADARIHILAGIPARVRFLSIEPLLGPIDLKFWNPKNPKSEGEWYASLEGVGVMGKNRPVDWVIVGGESGPHARPMNPEWVRSIRDQCVDAGVPFLFKQWGEWGIGRSKSYTVFDKKHAGEIVTNYTVSTTGPRSEIGKVNHYIVPKGYDGEASGFHRMEKLGKHAAGRLLDGRTWDEYPA